MICDNFVKASIRSFIVFAFTSIAAPVFAADYTLIPRSMFYNVAEQQNEYIAYIVDHKKSTITQCRTIYKIISNLLTAENCSAPDKLPFNSTASDASVFTTIVFTRSASTGSTVIGADGLWRLDQSSGKVEFCIFGYQSPKCVSLSSQS